MSAQLEMSLGPAELKLTHSSSIDEMTKIIMENEDLKSQEQSFLAPATMKPKYSPLQISYDQEWSSYQ